MNALKQYFIPFTGLALGKHEFEYQVDSLFFSQFEYGLVRDGNVTLKLELDKQETMMILFFEITGTVVLECDKCLADFNYPLNISQRQIVKFGDDEEDSGDEEIFIINRGEHELDVSRLIYEYITVAVPMVKNCNDDGLNAACDEQMIQRLAELDAENDKNNNHGNTADPRWDALKNIK